MFNNKVPAVDTFSDVEVFKFDVYVQTLQHPYYRDLMPLYLFQRDSELAV